jgi:predicted alpha/beta-fold hydrolase
MPKLAAGVRLAGLPLTSARCYSAAFTDDCHLGIEQVQERFPRAPLFAAGYSLGALILTKYLAEADSGKWPGEGEH